MAAGLNTLEALTREFVDKQVVDNFFTSSALIYKLMKSKRAVDGGLTIEQPITYGTNPDAGAWGGNFEELPMSQPNIAGRASFAWTYYQVPIVYSETDKLKNMGSSGVADLVETIAQNALQSLKDTMGQDIYGDGSNNALGKKRIDGLSAVITHNSNPSAGAYGGLTRASSTGSKSSFTGNAWWNGVPVASNAGSVTRWTGTFNISNASTQLDLNKLNQLFVMLSVGDDAPDLIVMGPALFARVWQLIQGNEHRTNLQSDTGMTGFRYIMFNGVPITVDHNIDDPGKIYILNTKYLFWRPHRQSDFVRSPLRIPHRQRIFATYIFWDGNMTCSRPNMQGCMTGATA